MLHRIFWLLLLSCWMLVAAQASGQSSRRNAKLSARKSSLQKCPAPSDYELGPRETCGGPPYNGDELSMVDTAPRDTTQPYAYVEQMPVFSSDMRTWFAENVIYPAVAHEAGIQGRVQLRFIVEVDGSLTDIRVARGISPELDAEALRLVTSMPCWEPGRLMGKAVRTYFSLPIKFYFEE